jgi:hypothetical protein
LMIDYLYLDDYDPGTLPKATPIPPIENGTGVESTIEHAVVVTQTDPPPQDPWSSIRSTRGFGSGPGVPAFGINPGVPAFGTGPSVTPFGAGPSTTAFGASPRGFGDIDPPPQPNANDPWGPPFQEKDKKKGKKKRGFLAVEPPPDSFLEMHAKMFAIASKYDIKSLEQTARAKFKAQFDCDWSPTDLIASIEIVCSHTPDSEFALRDALKDAIVRHATTLVKQPGFEGAVGNIDGLAYDLFCRKTRALEFK